MAPEQTSSTRLSIPRPQTRAELRDAVQGYLGITIPDARVCPHHATPWEAFCNAYFAETPWAVWKAARGLGGKSYLLAVLGWMEAVTLQSSVNILGGSGEQSERVHEYLRQFWMRPNAPVAALASDPSRRETRLAWGNSVKAQLASARSVRGSHFPRLRVDEADEVEWGILESARGQPMDKDGVGSHIVFSSTHQYADGTMTRLLREAAEQGQPIFTWCYKETLAPHGWLTEASMARFRATVSKELWRVEVELGEPSPEGRAVLPEKVEAMFQGPEERDPEGQAHELEPPAAGAVYATGADWGKQDETVIWTWRTDVYPMRLVAYAHYQRRPMPWMIEQLMERLRRYRGDAFHDATGVGTWHSDQFTEPCEDYVMVGKKRADLFMNYITAIERGEVVAPRRLLSAYHAHLYCRNKDLFSEQEAAQQAELGGGRKGHPPDPFVAAALAYAAALFSAPIGLVGGSGSSATAEGKPRAPTAVSSAASMLGRRA